MTSATNGSGDRRPVVLVLRFSALGDVAMISPVVTAAARRHPSVRFVVVTRSRFAPFFPEEVDVEGVDLGSYKGIRGLMRLARELRRKYRPVAVADLHDVIRTHVLRSLMRLRGIPVATIDKGRADKKALVDGTRREQLVTTPSRYADTIARLGFDPGLPVTAPLGPSQPDASAPRIGIAPFAAHQGKAYPLGKMAQAAAMMREARPDARIYWFCAPGEETERVSAIAAYGDTVVPLLGLPGGLRGELDLMATLDVMVSMDSGNMHLAALHGVPVVSLWGPTHPYAGFAGTTSPDRLRLQATMPCRPCSIYGNRPCRISGDGTYPCIGSIAPEAVARTTLSTLQPR